MRARWLRRVAGWLLVVVGVAGGLAWLGYRVDLVRVGLVVSLGLTLLWLSLDLLDDDSPLWGVEPRAGAVTVAREPRLATYVRVIEDHRSARIPTPALRDRLRAVAAARLEAHYGLALDDPRARQVLGPELTELLTGPVRRLSLIEIDGGIARIEEL